MKDILFGYASKTLNVDTDRLAEILLKKADDGTLTDEANDNALTELLKLDAERVGKMKPDTKGIFDNGHKKGLKEGAEQWESKVRESFGITDDTIQGDALIEAAKTTLQGEGVKPDKIKTSKEYLDLEQRMKTALADKEKEISDKVAEMQAKFTKEQTWQQVSASIRQNLLDLGPLLPLDASKADRQIDLFMRQFRDYDFQADEKEGFIPIKDGQRVEDKHMYAVSLSDLVKERAEMIFDFKPQQAAGNAGNKNGAPGRTVNKRFKSEGEYLEAVAKESTFEGREALYQAWTAQNQ